MDQRILPSATDFWPLVLGKSMDELRQSLLYVTVELEYTRNAVKEEIEKRDHQTKELLQLLEQACRERNEANDKCNMLLEKLVLPTTTVPPQPPLTPPPPPLRTPIQGPTAQTVRVLKVADPTSSAESDSISRNSSSTVQSLLDLDLSGDHCQYQTSPPAPQTPDTWPEIKGKLPEKGKLLQAVINAGPLLQTLLLAGPLPQWRHPPPLLDSLQIPPVAASLSGGSSVTDVSLAKISEDGSGHRAKHRRID